MATLLSSNPYLNKGRTKLICPQDPELDLTANDMGEGLITFGQTGDAVNLLPAAVRPIVSANLYLETTLSIEILKTSASADVWRRRVQENVMIEGEVLATDDAGNEFTYGNCAIGMNEFSSNGSQASYTFVLKGHRLINTKLA